MAAAPPEPHRTPDWMRLDWRGKHDASWLLLRVRSSPEARTSFCAGVLYDPGRDRVMRTAPILRYLLGLDAATLRGVAQANGWTLTVVKADEQSTQPPSP